MVNSFQFTRTARLVLAHPRAQRKEEKGHKEEENTGRKYVFFYRRGKELEEILELILAT
jgi:hypothetical protein